MKKAGTQQTAQIRTGPVSMGSLTGETGVRLWESHSSSVNNLVVDQGQSASNQPFFCFFLSGNPAAHKQSWNHLSDY